ncbi:MAG: ubiquitin-like small modifier protein 1 [Candidatus Bipolaricaulota bacterium]
MIKIKLFANLQETVGQKIVELDSPSTVREALRELVSRHPSLEDEVFADDGSLHSHLNAFIDGRNVNTYDGLDTELQGDQVLTLFSPLGGG